MTHADVATQILDLARWAPSGDNTQPWKFEIVAPDHIIVHGSDTREDCVYDLQGHASHLAHGTLLQTIEYAASQYGYEISWHHRTESGDEQPMYDVHLKESSGVAPHPLVEWIAKRATQRRPMCSKQLSETEVQALEASVGSDHTIKWLATGFGERFTFARFLFLAAGIRLLTPEAFEVHRRVIEWGVKTSKDRIPETAVGLSPLTLRISKWTFGSWRRMALMNSIPGATWGPRVELDLFPGLFCAAHYGIIANKKPKTIEDHVNAGRAVQRLWLTAASLGIQHQPEMTPLIFRQYIDENIAFTRDARAKKAAKRLAKHAIWNKFPIDEVGRICWIGRLGRKQVATRSGRLNLSELMQ